MQRIHLRIGSPLLAVFVLLIFPHHEAQAQGTCCSGGPDSPQDCNVGWSLPTQVAACPFGDSLQFTPAKPSRVRISVHYEDNFCNPKVGVPVDSIWLTNFTATGSLKLNDSRTKIFADVPTDASGNTRFLLASFSGCGNLTMRLYVSGKLVGIKTAAVRTTDTNADSCVTTADLTSACDLNFIGTSGDATDLGLINAHAGHAAVTWTLKDSLAACPAGDSASIGQPSGRPTRLRVPIRYGGMNCLKLGVAPEAMSLTWLTSTGNLRVNDKSTVVPIYADDSTRGLGASRVTVPSFSGCGTTVVQLTMAGVIQGTRLVTVRTTDLNADGRTNGQDPATCDLDYDGTPGGPGDVLLTANHLDHWRRNALHGTLVQRTSLQESPLYPRVGESELFWSPNGRWVSFSEHVSEDPDACKIFLAPSDPIYAPNAPPKQFTFAAPDTSDYDGSWSPLGDAIVFERGDYRVLRKGIPGLAADSTEILVTASGNPLEHGALNPSVSPNGQWVAFSRKNVGVRGFSLWKVPIAGGTATRLTNTEATGFADFYPRWSPDGQWITYQQELTEPTRHEIRKVMETGASDQQVYSAGLTMNAANPAFSPDGAIITGALGTPDNAILDTRTYTIDPQLLNKQPILNYPDHAIAAKYPYLFPRVSPDGTRLGLITKQVWTARRNMNLPPTITTIRRRHPAPEVDYAVADTAASLYLTLPTTSLFYNFQPIATDPEQDAITYQGFVFGDPAFGWDSGGPWLTVYTDQPGVHWAVLQVTTSSGGTDKIILICDVGPTLAPGSSAEHIADVTSMITQDGPNPTRGRFALSAPEAPGTMAELSIFDLRGRRVATVRGSSSKLLVWEGSDLRGEPVPPGVYLYRVVAGTYRKEGKVVVAR
jgi:Tol biopolymer transport system component